MERSRSALPTKRFVARSNHASLVCVASGAGAPAAGLCAVVGGIAGGLVGDWVGRTGDDSAAERACPPAES